MPLIPPNVSYGDRDFSSIRARLFATIRTVFPEWTDTNVFAFGNVLIELFSHVGDILGYYQDAQAREAFITTAVMRKSLLRAAKALGYTPASATAAAADVVLSGSSPAVADVPIPNGSRVGTPDTAAGIVYQVLNPSGTGYTLLAGQTSITVAAENSEAATDYLTSTGAASQSFQLSATPYLDGSATVQAANGDFQQVDDLLDATPSDLAYTIEVDQNDRATLRFGDGVQGVIPLGSITVNYKTGGGARGNVTAGALTRVLDQLTNVNGAPVSLSATNPLRSSTALDRTSNAKIRQDAPRQNRVKINSVAREDFVINAERVAGVARALFITKNQDPAIPENTGALIAIPTGGGYPGSLLKAAILTQLTVTYPPTTTFTVLTLDPDYLTINHDAVVYLAKGASQAAVRAAITTALTAFYAPTNADGTINTLVDFGANLLDVNGNVSPILSWSDVFNLIRDAAGVRKVDAGASGLLLNSLRQDVTLGLRQFPQLGYIHLVDGNTGASF